jgi:hypothetical protein
VTQVHAFQPSDAENPIGIGKVGQPFSRHLRANERFKLTASFELVGPGAADVARRRVTYRARFYARNCSTGERTQLGETDPHALVEGNVSYTATLPRVTLRPGLYRLRVVAALQDVPAVPGYLEVPVLQMT